MTGPVLALTPEGRVSLNTSSYQSRTLDLLLATWLLTQVPGPWCHATNCTAVILLVKCRAGQAELKLRYFYSSGRNIIIFCSI